MLLVLEQFQAMFDHLNKNYGMALCRIKDSLISTVWTHLRVLLIQIRNNSLFMLNSAYASARGVGDSLHLPVPSMNRLNKKKYWYSILNTKCIGVIDPEGPKKI